MTTTSAPFNLPAPPVTWPESSRLLELASALQPEAAAELEAFIRAYEYSQARATLLATWLRDVGAKAGDRVGVLSRDGLAAVLATDGGPFAERYKDLQAAAELALAGTRERAIAGTSLDGDDELRRVALRGLGLVATRGARLEQRA